MNKPQDPSHKPNYSLIFAIHINVAGLMRNKNEDDGDDGGKSQVGSNGTHTPGIVEPDRHKGSQRRTQNRRNVVGDTGTGVAHVGGEKLGQISRH